jgi:hypothetical protein
LLLLAVVGFCWFLLFVVVLVVVCSCYCLFIVFVFVCCAVCLLLFVVSGVLNMERLQFRCRAAGQCVGPAAVRVRCADAVLQVTTSGCTCLGLGRKRVGLLCAGCVGHPVNQRCSEVKLARDRTGTLLAAKIFHKHTVLAHGRTVGQALAEVRSGCCVWWAALLTRLQCARIEYDVLQRIQHPNIIRLHNVLETANHLILLLDYCNGPDLYRLIAERQAKSQGRPFTDLVTGRESVIYVRMIHRAVCGQEARHLVRQAAEAVAYLHRHHIAHRDIVRECCFFVVFFIEPANYWHPDGKEAVKLSDMQRKRRPIDSEVDGLFGLH